MLRSLAWRVNRLALQRVPFIRISSLSSVVPVPVIHHSIVSQRRSIHASAAVHNFLAELVKVKKLDKELVELKEEDLSEFHARGWGGGGQKTNKTANCVVLRHTPTGITVRVHTSRSLKDNMDIARARLRMKVDIHLKGDESVLVQEEKLKVTQNQSRKVITQKNLEGKAKLKKLLESEDDIQY